MNNKLLTLFFQFKPLSLNRAYKNLPGRGRVKTNEYKTYQTTLESKLNLNALSCFSRVFDPKKHEIHLNMIVYLKDLYTKDGRISKLSGDCGNLEKITNDVIFKKLGLDDSQITKIMISKNKGERDCFYYSLEIVNR